MSYLNPDADEEDEEYDSYYLPASHKRGEWLDEQKEFEKYKNASGPIKHLLAYIDPDEFKILRMAIFVACIFGLFFYNLFNALFVKLFSSYFTNPFLPWLKVPHGAILMVIALTLPHLYLARKTLKKGSFTMPSGTVIEGDLLKKSIKKTIIYNLEVNILLIVFISLSFSFQ